MKRLLCTMLLLISGFVAAAETMINNPINDLMANSNSQMARYQELTLVIGRNGFTTDSMMVGSRMMGVKAAPTNQQNMPIYWGGYRLSVVGEDRIGKDVTYILLVMPIVNRDRSPPAVKDEIFAMKFLLKPDGTTVPGYEERVAKHFFYGRVGNLRAMSKEMRVFKSGPNKYKIKYKECEVCSLVEVEV